MTLYLFIKDDSVQKHMKELSIEDFIKARSGGLKIIKIVDARVYELDKKLRWHEINE